VLLGECVERGEVREVGMGWDGMMCFDGARGSLTRGGGGGVGVQERSGV